MGQIEKLNAVSTTVIALTSVIGVGAAIIYYFKDTFHPVYLIFLTLAYFLAVELLIYRIWKVVK